MKLSKEIPTPDKSQADLALLHMLDRRIDDMESGRELSLEDAFARLLKKFIFSEYYVMKEIGLIFYRKKQNIHTRNRKRADQSYF